MIAPEEDEVMARISRLIPSPLLTSPFLEPLVNALVEEKEHDYYNSLMKSIGKPRQKWGSHVEGTSSLSLSALDPAPLKMPKVSFTF